MKSKIPKPITRSSAEEAAIAAFIRSKGVTRCPTACATTTQATVPAADRAALERYVRAREQARRQRIAASAQLFRVCTNPNADEDYASRSTGK